MGRIHRPTSAGWSQFYLNDVHTSRRPWLHRKRYLEIDALLAASPEHTKFDERRHPEEFAVAFLAPVGAAEPQGALRGMWGVPKRNRGFVARKDELRRLVTALCLDPTGSKSFEESGQRRELEVVGLGGVGKTQLVTELCYRLYPDQVSPLKTGRLLLHDYR